MHPELKSNMKIDLYSHHVKVSSFSSIGKNALLEFCRKMAQYGLVRVSRNNFERRVLRVYVGSTKRRTEFRFHIHQYQDLRQHLAQYGFTSSNIEIEEHSNFEPQKVEFEVKDHREPRENQVPLIKYLIDPGKSKVVTLQTGQGKMQPLDAQIKIPGGWTTMGDLKVGDVITAWDGSPTKVNEIFEHESKDIWRITFEDGRYTECGLDHLWRIQYNVGINEEWKIDRPAMNHGRWRIVSLEELIYLTNEIQSGVYIQLIKSEDSKEIDLPIDPYTMGIIAAKTNRYDHADDVDGPIPVEFGYLTDTWLIPDIYLNSSRAQRLSLLQALMDQNGFVDLKDNTVKFEAFRLQLSRQVQELVRSLGGIAKHTYLDMPGFMLNLLYPNQPQDHLEIQFPDPKELFTLPKKKLLVEKHVKENLNLRLKVKSIRKEGFKDCRCISIDHPDRLYVTDQYIVTHNTFISLKAINEIGHRTMIVVKGMYIDKWIDDVNEAFSLKPDDLIVVRGSSHFQKLISLAIEGYLTAKLIIVTSKTMFNYLKSYENFDGAEMGYLVPPELLYETLGVGIRLIDEVHQDYHLNFRQDLYSHVPKTISLSATLESDDPFINNMYRIQWPSDIRAPSVTYDKYIVVKSLWYSLLDPKRVRCKNAMKQYSHTKFEESILRDKKMLHNYVDMITQIVYTSYVNVREEGQKMIIFCGTVELCTTVRNHLAKLLPTLNVVRYVAEDEYEDLLSADIAVSTIQSAGTAVDIPNLRIVLMTTVINSRQANIQVLGRLRRLKDWPKITPEFLFISAREVDKHRDYAKQKAEKLDGKVLGFKELQTGFKI